MDAVTANAALSSLWQSLYDKLHDNPLRPIIVQIGSESSSDQVSKPDLEDDQKRWLIVGICLHSVIAPALRQYIPKTVGQMYNSFVRKNQINTQSFQNCMNTYKSKDLNYEAINNNSAIPRVKGKPDRAKYDYAVKSDVEFSKLFLPTSMVHYSGFDSSCDSSALLGIVINMDFPQNLKTVAEQVRRDVRNPWAHCNFSEWDVIKFQSSFQLMYQLVKNLQLPISEETAVLGTLTEWLTNGIQFLQGTTIGMELLQKLKTETHALSKYLLEVIGHTDESIRESHQAIVRIDQTLNATHNLVHELKKESQKLKTDMENVSVEVCHLKTSQTQLRSVIEESNTDLTILKAKTKDFENQTVVNKQYIDEMKVDLASVRFDQKEASDGIKEIKTEILYNRKDFKEIKTDVAKNSSEIHETKSRSDKIESDILQTKNDVMKNRDDISKLSQHMSSCPVSRREFFFVPDRVPCFAARKEEIERINVAFNRMSNCQYTQVICGLGGIGKTTLAVEFAWLYQTGYPAGIFWMSAETNDALEDSIQRLSIQVDKIGSDKKETLHKVLNWLSLLQEQWLLIIDNVDEDELCWAVKELVHGSWKRFSKGHVIITSRRKSTDADSDFHVTSDQCITLDVFSVSESKQFMISRSGESDDKNDSSLDTLVSELGGLPLALEQASAHIKALKCTYKHYLEKFQKKRLKFMQKSKSPIDVPQERRTVLTTWHLNFDLIAKQSQDDGLGTAAVTAMKVSAYLYADEIPQNIFNVGSPKVCDDDILDSLQEDVGAYQVSAILSRFSLFQETGPNTLSVHRLVQEVVRENVTDLNEKKFILECAVRMVNKALESTNSPLEAIREKQIGRTPLLLWSKLCLHANTVRKHLFNFAQQNTRNSSICFNTETSRLLQASSIYHSLNQRQDEALACQDQMLSILPALNISESTAKDFTCIKVPLLNSDRVIIQGNLIANYMTTDESNTAVLADPETLRLEGNNAFNLHKYHTAIQYYSEAVRVSCRVDPRVLSNRSLAYFKVCDYENALKDADRCISEYQDNIPLTGIETVMYKAYLWKAYAIAKLIRLGQLHERYEFVGLASAAVAGHLNNQCLLEYRMKIEYPIVRFKIIKSEKEFVEEMRSFYNMVYTTLLLQRGHYELPSTVQIVKSIQVIGIEADVKIVSPNAILLIRPEKSWFSSEIYVETELNIHFENVSLPNESGHVAVGENINATFYRCKFSNGSKACEKFPLCKGNVGCVNSDSSLCRKRYMLQEREQRRILCGQGGSCGIVQKGRSYVVVDNCIFDRCGGGGTCCEGEGAKMVIKNSIFQNMRRMGVEARHGGTVEVERCTIINIQFHGVAIGPRGFGKVEHCIIRGNNEEGIWCGGVMNAKWEEMSIKDFMTPNEGSVGILKGNLISQNGMSGVSFHGGSYEVSGNRIFDNWLWGMMVKSRSATSIYNNDIFENKCGGIRIGINYSAPVVVDGNTIRDHIGPAIHIVGTTIHMDLPQHNFPEIVLEGEKSCYSIPPFITTRNACLNNNCGHRHPTELLFPVQTCCYCHNISNNLQKCGRCKKATYCSKDCQTAHWKRHKNLCTIFQESYIVKIDLSKSIHLNSDRNNLLVINTTTIPLPDLGKGNPPDRKSSKKFIVKIQSGKEYTRYDPSKMIRIYDQTQSVFEEVRQSKLYHLVNECGVLAGTMLTTKKIYCWASFKNKGSILCIHTDNLPPFQDRW